MRPHRATRIDQPASPTTRPAGEPNNCPVTHIRGSQASLTHYGRRVRRMTSVLAAVLLALTAASCAQEADGTTLSAADDTGGSDDTTTDDNGNSNEEEGGGSGSGSIDWTDCGGGECADIEVPLDYENPDGDTITISVLRAPASGDRIGALFVNPGGPGGIASEFAATIAQIAPSEITERFDIVGVDTRGTGSSLVDCGGDFTELYGVDYTLDSPEDQTTLLDVSQDYVDGCVEGVGNEMLANMGTRDVARDMDHVRELMGDEQLSYLGYSYGTSIGQVYAELYPDRVRAMVIDGVVELGPTGIETAQEQALGFEQALEAFAEDCNGDDSCPIAPDALGALDELTAQVEQAPIPGQPRDLTPGELQTGLSYPLYDEFLWPELADAIQSGLEGDGSAMVGLADAYLGIASFDVYFAVNCLDSEWPDDPEELLAAGEAWAAEAAHFGPAIVNDYVRCAMWPVEAEPLEPTTAPGTPPIVVVSTTGDPATPYEAGVRTAEQLETGVLLTYEGEGHTVVFTGSPCVDDAVITYLVDLEPPEDQSVC
jgi:pimeloyl-ACP methyl ester carboxylesterase